MISVVDRTGIALSAPCGLHRQQELLEFAMAAGYRVSTERPVWSGEGHRPGNASGVANTGQKCPEKKQPHVDSWG